MSDREMCPWCGRPLATDDDWENIPEGEGEHLCWAHPYHTAECCDEDPEDIVRALRAKVEELEEIEAWVRANHNAYCEETRRAMVEAGVPPMERPASTLDAIKGLVQELREINALGEE